MIRDFCRVIFLKLGRTYRQSLTYGIILYASMLAAAAAAI